MLVGVETSIGGATGGKKVGLSGGLGCQGLLSKCPI